MHHQVGPRAVMSAVEQIGVPQIEGAMETAIRIELSFSDRVEAFGSLSIALLQFRAKLTRPGANRIGGEQLETCRSLHPELDLQIALEDADEYWIAELEALLFQPFAELGRIGCAGKARAVKEAKNAEGSVTVGRKRHRCQVYRALRLARLHVPEFQRLVCAPRKCPPPIGREHSRGDAI